MADLHYYFDPVCRFAWMTSKWVRLVQDGTGLAVEWRLISLRQVNAAVDYSAHFPPEYEAFHDAGLRMLRVAARARAELGPPAVDALQAAIGAHVFERPPWPSMDVRNATVGTPAHMASILEAAGLPAHLAAALDDPAWDAEILAETTAARRLTGQDVGTPILQVDPPDGPAFFGPVISRLPSPQQAVELWQHVVGLARFAGFSELKRSLREQPQLPVFGLAQGAVGEVADWHQGSTRAKHPAEAATSCALS